MEPENNKTYMTMVIVTFLAFAFGVTISYLKLQEYQDELYNQEITNPFK